MREKNGNTSLKKIFQSVEDLAVKTARGQLTHVTLTLMHFNTLLMS